MNVTKAKTGPKPRDASTLRDVRVQALLTRDERNKLPAFLADLGYPHRRPGEALSAMVLDLLYGRAKLVRGEEKEQLSG